MKNITYSVIFILTLFMTACGASSAASPDPASAPQGGAAAGELPATAQLLIGTLELDNTDQAVTAEQATELLPLWQTFQVLSDSDTAANQEKEALITQIQETMTDEQMQAITAMNLTRQDMFAIMQEQGIGSGAGASQTNRSQNGTSSNSGNRNFGPGGPPPDGEFPGGGPGFSPGGQGQNLSPDQIATAQAARQQNGGNFMPPMLVNAVIKYLQEKADS